MHKYEVQNGQVMYITTPIAKKSYILERTVCGNDINIKGYQNNIDTGETFIKLEFLNVVAGKMVTVEVNRAKLTANELEKIVKAKGGVILDKTRMLQFFCEKERQLLLRPIGDASGFTHTWAKICMENQIKAMDDVGESKKKPPRPEPDPYNLSQSSKERIDVYSNLGWDRTEDGDVIFKGEKCIGIASETEYVGDLRVQPKGTYENVKNLFDDYVWNSVELQTIAAIAASATVLGFMAEVCGLVLPNSIFSLSSKTTTGKSTVLELAASFGGCPITEEENTLSMSFEGTPNKIINNMGVNKGVATCIDDTKLADATLKQQMTEFLYSLSRGSEKERMHNVKLAKFRTSILISGEHSIMKFVKDVGGLAVRVLEFQNVTWTVNAESANNIKRIVRENYGHITPRLAERLLQFAKDNKWVELKEKYDGWHNRFVHDSKERLVYIEYTERITANLVLVMMGLELLGEVMEHKVDTEGVYSFLFNQIIVKAAEEANVGERAYNAIANYWKENTHKFIVAKKPIGILSEEDKTEYEVKIIANMGVIAPTKSKHVVGGKVYERVLCITRNQAKKILSAAGLDDEWNCMCEIGKKGLLMKHNPNMDNPTGFYWFIGQKMKGYKVLIEAGSATKMFDPMEDGEEEIQQ